MNNDMREYATFTVTARDGSEVEMAVIDEFEFEKKNYVAAAIIKDDTIDEDGVYIYRVRLTTDDFEVEKITNETEYRRVSQAYMEME